MGELINGNCRTKKAPAVFGWHPTGKLVCMKAAIPLATSSVSPRELWECNNRGGKQLKDVKTGEDEKIHLQFSPQFLSSFLMQEMKNLAKSGTSNTLTTAIITFPLHYTCKQRVHLQAAAELAGFQDIYLLSEEGLTAYYWFAKRVEQNDNKYSKNIVIVTCGMSSFVMYRRVLKYGENGQEKMIVEAVDSVQVQTETQTLFYQLKKIGVFEVGCCIPVLCKYVDSADPSEFHHLRKNAHLNGFLVEIVKNDEVNYFAVRAATLFSNNPKDLKKCIRNTLGTSVLIGVELAIASNQLLPKTCSKVTCTVKHYSNPHILTAYYTCGKDWMGNLWVDGVKIGAELKVTFELNSEGIWKVVSVTTNKNLDGEKKSWTWIAATNRADIWLEGNGSLVLKTSPNAGELKGRVGQENCDVGASDGGRGYIVAQTLTEIAMVEGVAVAGQQNVKIRQALKAIQPNENVMNRRFLKKIKLDLSEVKAE